jgi:hypothetical protein
MTRCLACSKHGFGAGIGPEEVVELLTIDPDPLLRATKLAEVVRKAVGKGAFPVFVEALLFAGVIQRAKLLYFLNDARLSPTEIAAVIRNT